MLKSGSVVKFNLDNQKYILLGLYFYNDRDLELDLEIIKKVRLFYPEIKAKDTFLFLVVFFSSIFDFIPYDEYKNDSPITTATHFSLKTMMKQRVKVLKHEDIKLYLLKNSLVNANVKRYLNYDIVDIFKRKKEQLLPYIPDLTH